MHFKQSEASEYDIALITVASGGNLVGDEPLEMIAKVEGLGHESS